MNLFKIAFLSLLVLTLLIDLVALLVVALKIRKESMHAHR